MLFMSQYLNPDGRLSRRAESAGEDKNINNFGGREQTLGTLRFIHKIRPIRNLYT